jgi:hypothetical protein
MTTGELTAIIRDFAVDIRDLEVGNPDCQPSI